MPARPLEGIRVLEMGQLLAGPFAGTILGYYGAEVIKVEPPGTGDPLRRWRHLEEGTSLWWRSLGRNKKCITLDLRKEAGRSLALRLAGRCDVVLENFRPGTMEKWGLGPEQIRKDNPDVVYARVSGYGQSGPYSAKPGFASVCEGVGGLRFINGFPGEPPVRPNLSLGDSLAGLHAALGVVMALYNRDARRGRDTGGIGQDVDVAIYEAVFNMMEALLPEYDRLGVVRQREGAKITGIVPTNTYPCAGGQYVIIGGNGDSIFKRLMRAAGRPDMADDPRYATNVERVEHEAEIDRALSDLDGRADRRRGRAHPRGGGRARGPALQRGGHRPGPALPGARDVRGGPGRRPAAQDPRPGAQAFEHTRRDRLAGACVRRAHPRGAGVLARPAGRRARPAGRRWRDLASFHSTKLAASSFSNSIAPLFNARRTSDVHHRGDNVIAEMIALGAERKGKSVMHRLLSMAAGLSDAELLRQVALLAGREREATVELVGHLAELDARKLHLAEGYGSLFAYCTGALRLAEHAAYNRIEAARLSRRFPDVLDLLADGSLNLSTARMLSPHLRPDNFETVVAQARGRSKREVEALVARLAPRPDVAATVRRLPARAQTPLPPGPAPTATGCDGSGSGASMPSLLDSGEIATAAPTRPTHRPEIAPLAVERYRVQFTIGGGRTRSCAESRNSCAARSLTAIPA